MSAALAEKLDEIEVELKPYDEMSYHPATEKLAEHLCRLANNTDPSFFRLAVAYYFAQVATMMRCGIRDVNGKKVPVNLYAINLATSGSGKGLTVNLMEDEVLDQFYHNFKEKTFPLMAAQNIPTIANKRSIRKSTDPDVELERAEKEFEAQGELLFSFDAATSAAIKQARHKLLMADAGSMNLQIDEIGTNLTSTGESFAPFLELYDLGKIKNKLVKNTADNARNEELVGRTPCNMMLFGTPSRLLDGGKTEDEFYNMMDAGYPRRSFFAYSRKHIKNEVIDPKAILKQQIEDTNNTFLEDLSDSMGDLADPALMNTSLKLGEDLALLLIHYRLDNEAKADSLPEHEELRKAELSHRHNKAKKLAGIYAFTDGSPEITEDHIYYAIKLTEDSGNAFDKLLTRDRAHVKLARYIADVKRPITQVDLVEDLPFYKGAAAAKNEMMQLAIAYGYQNNILIKKAFTDGVEFIRGESLEPTNLDEMKVSYSDHIAYNYTADVAKFDQLHQLTQAAGMHWCSHGFDEGHRCEDKVIPGFNLVVLDIDDGVPMSTAMMLLKDYKALFYTTKRHTNEENRYRIVLPTNYKLELDANDYKDFMRNLFDWLPFAVDDKTNQRSRKWLSHNGTYKYQDGQLLDVLPFIPKTSKNETYRQTIIDQQGMDNLERWTIANTGDGNRNNMLLRYAMILVDAGLPYETILSKVTGLNAKLPDKLEDAELLSTVMITVGKSIAKQ